jgi:DEAD/DEAH box helicase domain-containing protein
VRAYRGGYLPNERRAIEQQLFQGRLRAVISTNALELGIDVGGLDASILVGYPGTIASTWQQAGRSGRRSDGSLAIFIAQNDPIDQYLVRRPDYLFGLSPESAVVDPENPYVLQNHLNAAAFELPLGDADRDLFGPLTLPIAETLRDGRQFNEVAGNFYSTSPHSPAQEFSLRHLSNNTFAIIERIPSEESGNQIRNGFRSATARRAAGSPQAAGGKRWSPAVPDGYRVIANVDAISAPELVYPEAVYLHDRETYLVRKLDLDGKLAYVDRVETDYYTQAILESNVQIREERETTGLGDSHTQPGSEFDPNAWESNPGQAPETIARISFGDLDVSWKTVAFKKIKFETRENLGMGPVDIPAQRLETTGLWLVLGSELLRLVKSHGFRPTEGLVGIRNLMIQSLPLLAMCDPRDISGSVNSSNLGVPAAFVYDRYPGGLGYSEKGFAESRQLLELCLDMVDRCECATGCPSCVGLPNLRPAIHSDPDLTRGYPIPDKAAARFSLSELLMPSHHRPVG